MSSSSFSTLAPLPVVLALALAFPLAHAAPSVQASGSFIDGEDYLSTAKSGSFDQPATTSAFDVSAVGAKTWGFDSSTTVRAVSDGAGHFATEILNDKAYGSSAAMTASTRLVFTDSLVNNTGIDQSASFTLYISQLKFSVTTGTLSRTNLSSFSARIFVGGAAVPVWSSGFSLDNAGDGQHMVGTTTGTDLGLGAAFASTCSSGCGMFNSFTISTGATAVLDLGNVAAGDTLDLRYEVDLATETNTYGGVSSVSFFDPAGLGSGGGATLPPAAALSFTTPVPEPDSVALLAAGLGLVAAAARRRRRA